MPLKNLKFCNGTWNLKTQVLFHVFTSLFMRLVLLILSIIFFEHLMAYGWIYIVVMVFLPLAILADIGLIFAAFKQKYAALHWIWIGIIVMYLSGSFAFMIRSYTLQLWLLGTIALFEFATSMYDISIVQKHGKEIKEIS